MKALKIIVILVLILVVAVVVASLIAPKEVTIERSVMIDASKDVVFENILFFKNTEKWSPWNDYDPDMKSEIEGTDGTIGAIYKWEGNEDVGKGKQEITKIEEFKLVETKLTFIEPFESESTSYLKMSEENDSVKVTWGMYEEPKFPANLFYLFMNMDEMIGEDFDKGLERLKKLAEEEGAEQAKMYRGYSVNVVDFPGRTYLAVRDTLTMDNASAFFGKSFGEMMSALQSTGLAPAGPPAGLYFSWDEETKTSDMAAAVPVDDASSFEGNFEVVKLPANKALQIEHQGSYEGIGEAHYAMEDYCKENNVKVASPVMEEYVTAPQSEKDTSKWMTKIIYVKE